MNTPPTTQVPPPSIPRDWPEYPKPLPDKPFGRCSKCGIELNQVMSYSCPHFRCPTGMGPVIS